MALVARWRSGVGEAVDQLTGADVAEFTPDACLQIAIIAAQASNFSIQSAALKAQAFAPAVETIAVRAQRKQIAQPARRQDTVCNKGDRGSCQD